MTKRQWVTCAVLVSVVAFGMTGCTRPWFKKKGTKSSLTGTTMTSEWDDLGRSLDQPPVDETQLPDRAQMEGMQAVPTQLDVVRFDYDSAQIVESERGKIEAAAALMAQSPAMSVVLEGHCDERGSNEYNLTLGERRALAVRAYLLNLGMDSARIQTRSFGEERPKNPGHDEAAWSENRRVEFVTVQ